MVRGSPWTYTHPYGHKCPKRNVLYYKDEKVIVGTRGQADKHRAVKRSLNLGFVVFLLEKA